MPKYSKRSEENLATCNETIQRVFRWVLERYDHTIIEGHRPKERQDEMVRLGRSKTPWPTSKHNAMPSNAVDAGPYIPGRGIPWPKPPKDWRDKDARQKYIKDLCQWYHFAGYVEGMAHAMGIDNWRWGGDWDRDHDLQDQTFDDLPHHECED